MSSLNQTVGLHGGNTGGADKNTLELVSPIVTLPNNADALEWVGVTTFDFTKYELLYWVLNAKCTSYWQLFGLVDGVASGYYTSDFKHLNGGGAGAEYNNVSEWNVDPTSYMGGNDNEVWGRGYFVKNKVSNNIKGSYQLYFSNGRIIGDITVNSAKIDKFKITSERRGFGALFNPWVAGSTLTVYGVKKT